MSKQIGVFLTPEEKKVYHAVHAVVVAYARHLGTLYQTHLEDNGYKPIDKQASGHYAREQAQEVEHYIGAKVHFSDRASIELPCVYRNGKAYILAD